MASFRHLPSICSLAFALLSLVSAQDAAASSSITSASSGIASASSTITAASTATAAATSTISIPQSILDASRASYTSAVIAAVGTSAAATFLEQDIFPTQTYATEYEILTTFPGETAAATYYYPLNDEDIFHADSVQIEFANLYNTVCWYPISGNYGLLPRVLFYATIVFALVGRTHEWLIAGALAASLTYSGVAAIHACLLVWRGPAYGELDFYPLIVILSSSCLLAVPLLNWSSTLRHLGQLKKSKDNEPGSSRTIIVYWGFLVAVGFLATFVGWYDNNLSTGLVVNFSNLTEIQCTPPNGFLNTSAGQVQGWTAFYLTQEFLEQNNCIEPCSTNVDPYFGDTLFRTPQDLRSLTMREIDRNIEGVGINTHDVNAIGLTHFYFKFALMALPYVIAQGLWAVLFGRKTPAQARHKFYAIITSIRIRRRAGTAPAAWQVNFAALISLLAYLWALFILIICPPLFIFNLVAGEIFVHPFPQSENEHHIGAWGPWASTALILIAAMIAKYHNIFVDLLIDLINDVFWFIGYSWFKFALWIGSFTRSSDPYVTGNQDAKAPIRHRRRHSSRKSSIMPVPGVVGEAGSLVKNQLLDIRDAIGWWFRNAWQVVVHEWNVFAKGWTHPDEYPQKRKMLPKPQKRVMYVNEEDAAYAQISGQGSNEKDGVNITTAQTSEQDSFQAKTPGNRRRVQLGLLPGGQRAQRLINNVGLQDHFDIGGAGPRRKDSDTLPTHRSATPELVDPNWARLSAPLPPVPKSGSVTPKPPPTADAARRKEIKGPTRTVTWEEQPRRPQSAGSILEIARPAGAAEQQFANDDNEAGAQMGLSSSFADCAHERRRRRSQHYSPDLSPHTALLSPESHPLPARSADDLTSPSADPSKPLPLRTGSADGDRHQHPAQRSDTRSSFSADVDGPDRDPARLPVELHPASLPEVAPPVLDPDGSAVGYLQVERPGSMVFEDEMVLRKDQWGRYHIVRNGRGEGEE